MEIVTRASKELGRGGPSIFIPSYFLTFHNYTRKTHIAMASATKLPLLEFKAGRCFRTTGTNTVKPDPTKG